jgi:hypothetical protein
MRSAIRNPIKTSALLLLVGLAFVGPSGSQPPPSSTQPTGTREVDTAFRALDPKIVPIVEGYLRTDCEIGEVGVALKRLLAVAEQVTPYLRAVVQQGPPSPIRAELGRSLEESWAARQRFLQTPEARELGEESFRMMQSIRREDYVREQQTSLDAKYRERAALALRQIEGGGKYGSGAAKTPGR